MDCSDISSWLTVEEVAKRLHLCEDRVRRLIRTKKLRASKIGKWLISPEDVRAFVVSRMNMEMGGETS